MLKNQTNHLTAHTVTYHDGSTATIRAHDFDAKGYQAVFFDEDRNTIATVMNTDVRSIVRDPAADPPPPKTRKPESMTARALVFAAACIALWIAVVDWLGGF